MPTPLSPLVERFFPAVAPTDAPTPAPPLAPTLGCWLLVGSGVLAGCGPGLPASQGAAPGQSCSVDAPLLHPVPLERVLDREAVEAALAGVGVPGEATFSLRLRAPENAEPRQPELAPVTVQEPVLVLGGTLDEATTGMLADALAEARTTWVEGELPRTLRVELRSGPADRAAPRIELEPSVGCAPTLVDRRRIALGLEEVTRVSGTRGISILATLLVDATGRVAGVRFDEAGEGFNERALLEQVLREAPFHPAIRDGIPVSTWVTLPVQLQTR